MLTAVIVSITKFNNRYHVVISKLVSITMCVAMFTISFLQCGEGLDTLKRGYKSGSHIQQIGKPFSSQ